VKNIANDIHSTIFSPFDKTKRVSLFNANLPYIFIAKSPKTLIIKMMEDMNNN
jgi:hypothetical protein